MKEKIDAVIICFNEEDVIEDAIKSLKSFAVNILVIDSASTDKTVELAKKSGAHVVIRKFENFSDQRNFAIREVRSPWVIYLDADERLTPDFKKEAALKIDEGAFSAFTIKRKTFYFNKDWGFNDKVVRVFKVDKFDKWSGVVHETANVKGEIGVINSPVLHFTHRNIEQMVEKTNKWSEYEAQLRYGTNHPKMRPWRFVRVMVTEFMRSYFSGGGYKNGTYGFIESMYQAYSIFITYAKLWEMQKGK